ncbi:hypothetical protein T02_4134 [Trichinella nativa]|uniref:Uncharacterized protein n=1 Tax=Trichinella nativa TaxID=6335 RepID=A0A0V1KJ18_9BILA|nr:hypothetical protein T02_4134 [Trichinella nativa]
MECCVRSMNKSLRHDITQVLLDKREQLSAWNTTLKYAENYSLWTAERTSERLLFRHGHRALPGRRLASKSSACFMIQPLNSCVRDIG